MDAEERRILASEYGVDDNAYVNGAGSKEAAMDSRAAPQSKEEETQQKKPNMISKFMRPDKHTDYSAMRRLVPKEASISYPPHAEDDAFFNPAVTNITPLLWIPRDPMGVSRQECRDTGTVIPITDEGAYLDDKNKVVWDARDGRPPIYQDKIYY